MEGDVYKGGRNFLERGKRYEIRGECREVGWEW